MALIAHSTHMLVAADTMENTLKRASPAQLTQVVDADGKITCRRCGDEITGKAVFCSAKSPRCRQAYHRDMQEKTQKMALEQAFQAGVQQQQAAQQQQQPMQLTCHDVNEVETFKRKVSEGWDDATKCVYFNEQILDRKVDGWQKTTLTIPINLQSAGDELMPFLAASRLERDDFGYASWGRPRMNVL